jgi:hypothetical protein
MDQLAAATALKTFIELMEIHDSFNRASQCHNELHKLELAIQDSHPGNHSHE